jgi:triphosphoribosyl-dephospho-CoA synthase
LDVTDTSSQTKIQSEELKPIEVFSLCAERDSICSEWVTGFKIIFEEGYPNLNRTLGEGLNINDSTVTTFLEMLSTHPDSLIQRKNGYNKAREISNTARRILDAGGVNTTQGKELLYEMDEELSVEGSMNPGTTADLTAASLFVLLLSGWRP